MRRVCVGDVIELQRRKVEVDPAAEYAEIGVRSFGRGIFHKEALLGIELGNKRVFEVHPGDLILSNVFAWEGAVGLAQDSECGRIGSHRFMTYTPKSPDVDANYLRYYFTSEDGIEKLGIASPGSAGRNRTLAVERFEAIELTLPDIDEQRQIAGHLDALARRLSHISALRRTTATRSAALGASLATQPQLSDEQRSEQGWRQFRLGEVMTEATDAVAVELDKQYPNLGIYSFGRGVFGKPPIDGLETSAKKLNRVRSGQFIYSRLFAFEGAYAYVPPEFDGVYVSGEFPSFDVNPDLAEAPFIAAVLRSPRQWGLLAGSSKGLGLRRQRIKVEALMEHRVWLPPMEQQQKVVAGLDQIDRLESLVAHSNHLSAAILPSALNRAFAGLA